MNTAPGQGGAQTRGRQIRQNAEECASGDAGRTIAANSIPGKGPGEIGAERGGIE